MRHWIIALACLALSACATPQSPYDAVSEFRVGETTFDQARDVLGAPTVYTEHPDGTFTAVWSDSSILGYAVGGAVFDADGVMIGRTSRTRSGAY